MKICIFWKDGLFFIYKRKFLWFIAIIVNHYFLKAKFLKIWNLVWWILLEFNRALRILLAIKLWAFGQAIDLFFPLSFFSLLQRAIFLGKITVILVCRWCFLWACLKQFRRLKLETYVLKLQSCFFLLRLCMPSWTLIFLNQYGVMIII